MASKFTIGATSNEMHTGIRDRVTNLICVSVFQWYVVCIQTQHS